MFEVLSAASEKIEVLWDVAPYSSVSRYKCFERICNLHLQGRRWKQQIPSKIYAELHPRI